MTRSSAGRVEIRRMRKMYEWREVVWDDELADRSGVP